MMVMKILTLKDLVAHNANVTDRALRKIKGLSKSVLLLSVADLLIAYLLYAREKDLKNLKEDIRVMRAELILDENEIKVLRERLNKEKAEKES